jgi:hypothetical protein
VSGYRFHLEHIIPIARGGSDGPSNRALACATCNLAKSDRTSGIDPQTNLEVMLFNPRKQDWDEHFQWADDRQTVIGQSATGRATVAALDMNSDLCLEARLLWFETDWLP